MTDAQHPATDDPTPHTHPDGTTHAHAGGDQPHTHSGPTPHRHADGTEHTHSGGDAPHTHSH